jgi:hypothetical protein
MQGGLGAKKKKKKKLFKSSWRCPDILLQTTQFVTVHRPTTRRRTLTSIKSKQINK